MAGVVRQSKYRHVFANDPKPDQIFSNYRLSTVYAESNGIKASASYFAVSLEGGGGPIAIVSLNKLGRHATDSPVFYTHTGAVVDFDFSPFFDNVFGTCSEDTTIKVWQIPEGGLTENISTPIAEMKGHSKRVSTIRFHPTAGNIVVSASVDQTIKVWDITKAGVLCDFSLPHQSMDIVCDHFGKLIASAGKDKKLRILDPRASSIITTIDNAHDGVKSNKLVYLGETDLLLSTGFNKTSGRQFKIWDPRNTSTEVFKSDLDSSSGLLMPFFDADSGLLFLAGKGDGNIRYYEFVDGLCHPITDFRSTAPAKGVALMPRRGVNTSNCEVARILKVTTDSIIPLSFVVPRKSDAFQDDLYPETIGSLPAVTADQWMNGSDALAAYVSLDPKDNQARCNNGLFSLSTAIRSRPRLLSSGYKTPSGTKTPKTPSSYTPPKSNSPVPFQNAHSKNSVTDLPSVVGKASDGKASISKKMSVDEELQAAYEEIRRLQTLVEELRNEKGVPSPLASDIALPDSPSALPSVHRELEDVVV